MKLKPCTERMNKYHDQRIENPDIVVEDLVLLFNYYLWEISSLNGSSHFYSRLQVFPHGAVELKNYEGTMFMVNR